MNLNYEQLSLNIFDSLKTGIIMINKDNKVAFANRAYTQYLSKTKDEIYGKDIREIIPHTRLHIVCKTGIAEFNCWQPAKAGYLCGNRIPIYHNGKIIGAIAELIIGNVEQIDKLTKELAILESKVSYLSQLEEIVNQQNNNDFIFNSLKMKEIYNLLQKASLSDTTIMITGETGVGKEVVAKHIYNLSNRNEKPFIKVNCAAIPDNLIESELFGYTKGAFTGADPKGKIGKFELANEGIIFLDEISSLSLSMQSKLLRVLQEREVERIGDNKSFKLDIKVIAASNKPLENLVKQDKFREDLYYRINVVKVEVPPLRERKEDIIPLTNTFLKEFAAKLNKPFKTLTEEAKETLVNYAWPGNVRELKNIIERLSIMVDGSHIGDASLQEHTNLKKLSRKAIGTLREELEQKEKRLIIETLENTKGNRTQAAKTLDINRTTLYSKMHKYNITDTIHPD